MNEVKQDVVVSGMTCVHCQKRVNDALIGLKGVEEVNIDLSSGAVEITSKKGLKDKAIKKAVEDAGYKVVE